MGISILVKAVKHLNPGPDLLTCMLSTFGPPTIWAISLEFCGELHFGGRQFLRSML